MRRGLLTWVFWAKIHLGGWKGYVIDEWGSYACARFIPITLWVVSKNELNCLLENKMISSLIWRHVRLLWFQSCALTCEEELSVKHNPTPSESLWIRRPQLICYRLLVTKFQSGVWVIALRISVDLPFRKANWLSCPLHMILKSCWVHLARRGDDTYSLP